MRGVRRHSAVTPLLLACILVVGSACTADRVDSTDRVPEATSSTTTTEGTVETPDSTGGPVTTTVTMPTTTTTTQAPLVPPTYESVTRFHWIRNWSSFTARGLSRWQRSVPAVEDIRITSTADGAEQPALWLPPVGDGDKPLLLILHSWSSNYLQHAGIPFGLWAQENGWAVIAPDFRGRNNNADAIGSELAVQDVVDAIDFAVAQEGVDGRRVFAVGYSGGGMMGLLLAGRHPDKVTAVAAWGPVYDLIDFYGQSRVAGRHYAWDIQAACGGDPRDSGTVHEECLRRSPHTYLDVARDAGVPVFIGQGLYDSFVSPRQGANAFNQLADPADRLSAEQVEEIARTRRIPAEIEEPISTESYLADGDPVPLFARQSAAVTLVYFSGGHEMAYQAAMRWFATDPR